jgi:DNA-binding NtrC family response regulator
VVDDDRGVRTALRVNLSKAGHSVTLATNVEEALAALRSSPFDLVITDVKMPGETGLALLGRIREAWADTPVIVMTGYGSVEDAVSAMKAGAADYIIKPVEKAELLLLVDRALQTRALRAELIALRQEVEDKYGFDNIIGTSDAMVRLYEDISAVAASSATVLLHGPTGTGKELLAHAIHYRSARRSGPLVPVNCGAIPEQLLESELFGHERGAFTGAVRQHVGKFEQADGGTKAAAGVAVWDVPARWRNQDPVRRRAHCGRDQSRPSRRRARGTFSRRLVLPSQRRCPSGSSTPRPA